MFLSDDNKIPFYLNLDLYSADNGCHKAVDDGAGRCVVFLLRSIDYQFAGEYLLSKEFSLEKQANDTSEYCEAVEKILKNNATKLVL